MRHMPFAFSASRLTVDCHPLTQRMMETINEAGAFHACHSSVRNERRACHCFVKAFHRDNDIDYRSPGKESIPTLKLNAVLSSSSKSLSVPKAELRYTQSK